MGLPNSSHMQKQEFLVMDLLLAVHKERAIFVVRHLCLGWQENGGSILLGNVFIVHMQRLLLPEHCIHIWQQQKGGTI